MTKAPNRMPGATPAPSGPVQPVTDSSPSSAFGLAHGNGKIAKRYRVGRSGSGAQHRAAAVGLIVSAHLALGIWLARAPEPTPTSSPLFIAVDLSPGQGSIQGPVAARAEPSGEPIDAEAATEPDVPDDYSAVTPVMADAEPSKADPVSSPPPESVLPVPVLSADAAPSDDVLKMVEALTGMTAAHAAAPDATTQAARAQAVIVSRPGGGDGCELGETIRTRLMADQPALKELADYPVANRSVSHAILLWNGKWLAGSMDGDAPALPTVRSVILEAVVQAPDGCRTTPLQGPRFVFLTSADATPLILVIGSGDWRWADLRASKAPRLLRWFGLARQGD